MHSSSDTLQERELDEYQVLLTMQVLVTKSISDKLKNSNQADVLSAMNSV